MCHTIRISFEWMHRFELDFELESWYVVTKEVLFIRRIALIEMILE